MASQKVDDVVWVPTVFSKNRERLIKHDAVIEFFNEVLATTKTPDQLNSLTFDLFAKGPLVRVPDLGSRPTHAIPADAVTMRRWCRPESSLNPSRYRQSHGMCT